MILAPIGISTYSRINHLKQTIESLKKNTLAKDSELYIFSDAPKKGDEEIVSKVREYIHSVDGFKEVHIIQREVNGRVANSRGGMKQLLDKYGKIIFLEDDIVTAPGFLSFLNSALNFYEDNEDIISVSGYSLPNIVHQGYKHDIYMLPRYNAWGVGMWKDKFEKYFKSVDKENFQKLDRSIFTVGGEDIFYLIEQELRGELDAGDVKMMYQQAIHKKYTVYPKKSLVQNIGHDGSGVHCGVDNKFYHNGLWDKVEDFEFIKDIQIDKKILRANYNFRKVGIKIKLIQFTKQIGIYSMLKRIKDRF